MRTTIIYHMTEAEGDIQKRVQQALHRLSNFHEAADLAMADRGHENPKAGWNACVKDGSFAFDQFLSACEWIDEVIKAARARPNPIPAMAEAVAEGIAASLQARSDLNEMMARAMR